MFQHAFQSGSHLEIFDSKISKEKDKNFEKLFKIFNPNGVTKVFDKVTKGYIYELDDAMKTKMQFPKNEKQELGLVQHFLVLQIFIPVGTPFSLEIVVTDTSKNKRRLNFTTSIKAIDKTYFHAKIPVDTIKRGVWLNLSIDLISFFDLFKGHTFRSIDSFILGAVCKLRRIFTMKSPLIEFSSDDEYSVPIPDSQQVPKNLNFLPGVTYCNQMLTVDSIQKQFMQTADLQASISDEESFSKNSTGISQALKVRGLQSNTKEHKNSISYSNNNTNNRLQQKPADRKGLKTQQVQKNSLMGEHEKRIASSKPRDQFDNSLQIRGIPKRNNLVANYDLENDVNGNSDEMILESYGTPEKFEKYEESAELRVLSPDQGQILQRKTASIGPKARNFSSKYKKSPQPRNITEEDEEEKVSGHKNNKSNMSKIKSKVDERVSRLQKEKEEKRIQKQLGSTQQEQKADRSPFSRRVASATSKFMINESKQKEKEKEKEKEREREKAGGLNPWSQPTNAQPKDAKYNSQYASPKGGIFASPRPTVSNQSSGKKTTPQTRHSQKIPSPSKVRQRSSGNQDALKNSLNGSSDRFNTTGKFSNNRYDMGNKGEYDLIDQNHLKDEIESIEENLEYEVTSNTSGMNGSKGFSDYKDKQRKGPMNLVDLAEANGSNKKGWNSSNKKNTVPTGNKFKTPLNQRKNSFERDSEEKMANVYTIPKHDLEDFEDSLERSPHGGVNGHLKENIEEERKKINAIENQVNNMVSQLRPYSPPYSFGQGSTNPRSTLITKKNDEVVMLGQGDREEIKENKGQNEMMEVVYDPVWNCYYHPKSNTYYEMKE